MASRSSIPRAARTFVVSMVATLLPAGVAAAQAWNDPRSMALVDSAIARRAEQLADTALRDYQADAKGYLTFLAQVGEGFREPPRIIKADQLALQVYWRAPRYSKQVVVGRRDTLLLPTDIQYHRDHLGIVQNNLPDIIRIGEGDEVADVPHPLSAAGRALYDYAIGDSMRITIPGRVVQVYELKVRPKDDRQPRVIGAIYLDQAGGTVVRMALNFTHAAFLDKQLEDLAVVLENGLVEGRFWLPRRQEIEIRRTATWMDYPARGIIRGRWEIDNYRLNAGLRPEFFGGPEIVMVPAARQRAYTFPGRILDSLPPDVRAVTDEDVRRVQTEARALVRAQALQRARRPTVAARGISDFVRVNRVEGLAIGAGVTQPLGNGFTIGGRARYGFASHAVRGQGLIDWQRPSGAGVTLTVFDDHRQAGDAAEMSRVVSSIAAQEFGADPTDPYRVAGSAFDVTLWPMHGYRPRFTFAIERHERLAVHAAPASGTYEPTLDAAPFDGTRLSLQLDHPTSLTAFGFEAANTVTVEKFFGGAGAGSFSASVRWWRASFDLTLERPVGRTRFVARTIAAAAQKPHEAGLIPQAYVYFGGPTTAPGYDYHTLAGTAGLSQRLEWRLPVPFVSLPLGRFGRAPASATLAPYAHLVAIQALKPRLTGGPFGTPRFLADGGLYPSVGVGLLTLFDLARFDVARGLRDGRWSFSFDISREFWRIL